MKSKLVNYPPNEAEAFARKIHEVIFDSVELSEAIKTNNIQLFIEGLLSEKWKDSPDWQHVVNNLTKTVLAEIALMVAKANPNSYNLHVLFNPQLFELDKTNPREAEESNQWITFWEPEKYHFLGG